MVKVTTGAIWTLKAILSEAAALRRFTLQDNVELDLQPHCEFNNPPSIA